MNSPQRIVVLTGAGISAESGISTFRDNNGLWENHRFEDLATPEAFVHHPKRVQRFYNLRRAQLHSVEPNAAHIALAKFEADFKGDFLLVTQNVDDLHERAGSQQPLHMHGELRKVRCTRCQAVHEHHQDISVDSRCPSCESPTLRPHIVWLGEMPLGLEQIDEAIQSCDLFISIGTSGHVYPAAGFVERANQVGARTLEINLEPSLNASAFNAAHHGPASQQVPAVLSSLIKKSR